MADKPWFKVRANGLGWTPISWQGWLITIGSAALVILANIALMARLSVFHR